MADRRDPEPEPGTGPPVIASVAGRLSPIQEAWSAYVDHGLNCPQCRSLAAGPCDEAERLHGAFQMAGETAFERLTDETP